MLYEKLGYFLFLTVSLQIVNLVKIQSWEHYYNLNNEYFSWMAFLLRMEKVRQYEYKLANDPWCEIRCFEMQMNDW